jgi:hypothetical protein
MLDQVSIIKSTLAELNAPARILTALSGLSDGTVSNILAGTQTAPERIQELYDATASLKRLVELARPLPLDFRRSDVLREMLKALRDGRLRVCVELDPPAEPVALWNIYISHDPENGDSIGKYFARRGRDVINRLRINPRGADVAASLCREDAERVATLLVGGGFRAAIVPLKRAGTADKFEDVWQET